LAKKYQVWDAKGVEPFVVCCSGKRQFKSSRFKVQGKRSLEYSSGSKRFRRAIASLRSNRLATVFVGRIVSRFLIFRVFGFQP